MWNEVGEPTTRCELQVQHIFWLDQVFCLYKGRRVYTRSFGCECIICLHMHTTLVVAASQNNNSAQFWQEGIA